MATLPDSPPATAALVVHAQLRRRRAADNRLAFAIRGQGVKVQSENERLSAEGQRIHTGESDEPEPQVRPQLHRALSELCRKYPIYAELRNLFDLALACAWCASRDWPTGSAGT